MIRLERNILDHANSQLRVLEDHVLDAGEPDPEQVAMTHGQLQALLALTKLRDSGMSDECLGMLEEIERRTGIIIARLANA